MIFHVRHALGVLVPEVGRVVWQPDSSIASIKGLSHLRIVCLSLGDLDAKRPGLLSFLGALLFAEPCFEQPGEELRYHCEQRAHS